MKTIYTKVSVSLIMSLLMIMAAGDSFSQRRTAPERRSYSRISRSESRTNDNVQVAHSRSSDRGYRNTKGPGNYSGNEQHLSNRSDAHSYRHHNNERNSIPGHSTIIIINRRLTMSGIIPHHGNIHDMQWCSVMIMGIIIIIMAISTDGILEEVISGFTYRRMSYLLICR